MKGRMERGKEGENEMEIDEELGEREVERKKWVPFHVSSL